MFSFNLVHWERSQVNVQCTVTVRNFRRLAKKDKKWFVQTAKGGQGDAVMKALASTNVARVQIPASTPYVGWVCCLLLVLSFATRGFSPGTPFFPCPQKPTCPNSNSISNARTRSNEFIRTPKCSVGEQIIITSYSYKFFTITVTLTNWPLTFQPRKVNHSEGRFHIIQKEEKGHLSAIGEGRAPRRPSESAYESHCRAISHVHRRGSKFKNLSQEDNCSGN